MAPTTRSKTKPSTIKATPEQKGKVVKKPATTKRTIKKTTAKGSGAPRISASKKKRASKSETDAETNLESDQASASGSTSVIESQSEAKPEPTKSTAKKRGRKPKTESNVESSQPSDSQTLDQGMSAIDLESESEAKPKTKKGANGKGIVKTKKEPKPKKEPKVKQEKAKKVVKPEVNKKEKRRKIKASEIPGFSSLPADMASRVVRVLTQRIFVLSRSQEGNSRETFEIIGSTGSTYTVRIDDNISCNCIDFRYRGLHCKHILTILLKVYRLHFSNKLFTSLRTSSADRMAAIDNNSAMVDPSVLVSNEVREKIINVIANKSNSSGLQKAEQRPLDTSDCPVCFETFEPENINFIAFCFTCGNNIHKQCLQQWISSKGGIERATCVYCRAPWIETEENPRIKKWHEVDSSHREGGFVNFSEELGITRKRDQSSYGNGYLNYIE